MHILFIACMCYVVGVYAVIKLMMKLCRNMQSAVPPINYV